MIQAERLEDLIDGHLLDQETDWDACDDRLVQVTANRNSAFGETMPETLVQIPIAAAQEPLPYTEQMLGQLARQASFPNVRPFSVVLSANYPDVENERYEAHRQKTVELIKDFQASTIGQRLPLSYFEQQYPPDTTIGTIRRDLSNVALRSMRIQYLDRPIPTAANILIADIDTWKLSPRYMSSQQSEIVNEGLSWTAANKRYLTSNGTFPNLDRAVHALNLAHRLTPYYSYDCHATYRVETFIQGEGFSGEDVTGETHLMRERAQKAMGDRFAQHTFVEAPGAIAISYPRRPFEKFRKAHPSYEFWHGFDFTMQDSYREGVVLSNEDISLELSNYFVADAINDVTGRARLGIVQALYDEQPDVPWAFLRRTVDEHIANILRKADFMLDLQLGKLSIFDCVSRP